MCARRKLDWMGVFEYSDVDNAGSYRIGLTKVDAETITRSAQSVDGHPEEDLARESAGEKRHEVVIALVEGPSKDNPLVWEARLEGMAPDIDGKIYLTDIEVPGGIYPGIAETGDVVRVEVTKTDDYDLIGRIVEILPRRSRRRKSCNGSPPCIQRNS